MAVSARRVWPNLEQGGRIRRARPGDSRRLTWMERVASEAELGHIFGSELPYPTAEVRRRWRRLLREPQTQVCILERGGHPAGFVAFDADTVRHLGVVPEQSRRGYGTALLRWATAEILAGGSPEAQLWVLTDNVTARSFYRAAGWRETDGRRDCEFPPYPEELRLRSPPLRAVTSTGARQVVGVTFGRRQ